MLICFTFFVYMLKVVNQYSYFNKRNIYRPLVRTLVIHDKMHMVYVNIGINIPYDHQITIGWITSLYIVQHFSSCSIISSWYQSINNWLNHFAIHRSINSLLVQSFLVGINQFRIGWIISLHTVQSFLSVLNRFYLVSINYNREVESAVFNTNQLTVGWIISQ